MKKLLTILMVLCIVVAWGQTQKVRGSSITRSADGWKAELKNKIELIMAKVDATGSENYSQLSKYGKELSGLVDEHTDVVSKIDDANFSFYIYQSLKKARQKLLPAALSFNANDIGSVGVAVTYGNQTESMKNVSHMYLAIAAAMGHEEAKAEVVRVMQTNMINNQIYGNTISSPVTSPTTTYGRGGICSQCGGKGWIAGSSSPKYGLTGTYYCQQCNREVTYSHSHDRCPSCRGTGRR